MLESGSLDAFAADKLKLAGLTAEARAPRSMRVLPDDLSYEPQAFAVPRNDSTFRLEVDRALSPGLRQRRASSGSSPTGLAAGQAARDSPPPCTCST